MDSTSKRGRGLGLWDIVLYATAMNFGIRWLATGAATGPVAIPIWIIAAALFLVPLSLATMALAEKFPGDGAIYGWTRETMGPFAGFLCGWVYWACNLPYFAALLIFAVNLIAGLTGLAVLKEPLGVFGLSSVIVILVGWMHSRGIGIGKWLPATGAIIALLLLAFLVGAGFYLSATKGSATDFAAADYLPALDGNAAILWATMVFGYGGAEGVALLRNEARGGAKTIIKALILVGCGLALAYIVGTAAMLMILPQDQASRLDGLPGALMMAALNLSPGATGARLGMSLIAGLVVFTLGGLSAWFGAAARLPFAAGIDNLLPAIIGRRDAKTGAPYVAIWVQTGLVVALIALSQAGTDSLAGVYDFIVAMSTLSYTLPFLFLFVAWWLSDRRVWARWTAVMGFVVAFSAIACSLVPPPGEGMDVTVKLLFATAVLLVSGAAIYGVAKWRKRA